MAYAKCSRCGVVRTVGSPSNNSLDSIQVTATCESCEWKDDQARKESERVAKKRHEEMVDLEQERMRMMRRSMEPDEPEGPSAWDKVGSAAAAGAPALAVAGALGGLYAYEKWTGADDEQKKKVTQGCLFGSLGMGSLAVIFTSLTFLCCCGMCTGGGGNSAQAQESVYSDK